MTGGFQTEFAERDVKVVILVPSEQLDWQGVGVFCASALPGVDIQVKVLRDSLVENLEGVDAVFLVDVVGEWSVEKIQERFVGHHGFLEIIATGDGGVIYPWQVGRHVLQKLGTTFSEENIREFEVAVWPIEERCGGAVIEGGREVEQMRDVETSLEIPVGMLTVIQEHVVIHKPRSTQPRKLDGSARVLHPSRVPAAIAGKGGIPRDPERIVLNTGLEKTIGVQDLRVNRRRSISSIIPSRSSEEVGVSKEKRALLETDLRGRKDKKKRKLSWRGVAVVLGVFLLIGLAAIFGSMGKAWSLRDRFERTLEDGGKFFSLNSREDVTQFANEVSRVKGETQEWWGVVGPLLPFFGHSSGEVDELLVYADRQTSALNSLLKLQNSSQVLASSVWQGKSSGGFQFVAGTQMDGERALKALAELGLELQRRVEVAGAGKVGQIESLLGVLKERRKMLSAHQRFLSLLGEATGEKKKKIYAVLLHDSSNLRAPEGSIAGMALLQFEGGRLAGYQAINPFLLDEAMLASVQPPEELKRVLGVETWVFTQSNWDPDFSISSKQMRWFLEKQLKVRLDGVVSINDDSLRKVLRALRGVEITSEGVVDESDVSRLLGSNSREKGVIATELMSAVLKKMESASSEQLGEIFSHLGNDARAGRVILNVSDPNLEKGVQSLGWSGNIITPDCPVGIGEGRCVVDTLYAVDSHLGAVSSPLVEKRAEHTVFLSEGMAEHRVVFWYQNNASTGLPDGRGVFQNYLRLYTPGTTEKFSVRIGSEELSEEGIVSQVEEGRRKTSFTFDVLPGERVPVEIRYVIPLKEPTPLTYALFLQRQPGLADFSHSLVVNIERSLSAKTVAPLADVVENVVAYDLRMSEHQFVAVEVARRE